ncbi:hypothetical protein [Massilia sp. PWRC2]|uniref:hypothetical protein n=1 Tax=Massilia sp. PWRC2 TaxID=2804626 RepID=UPI003CEE7B9C
MNSPFHHLALADVLPGMVLSDVLLDRQGQVLLPEGAVLTAAIIALLPRHGIDRLAVLKTEQELPPAVVIDEAAVTARLRHLFRHCGPGTAGDSADEQHSASAALHAYLLDYRLNRELAV